MNLLSVSKKTAVLVLAVFLIGIGILFRDRVSRLLSFDFREVAPVGDDVIDRISTGTERAVETPQGPRYSGRDPAEVRPRASEIEGLTESQKEALYSQLRAAARTVADNPDYFSGWIELGLLKKVIGDYEGARDAWEYAGAIRPENSLSFANLGELYGKYILDYPKAEANFRKSIQNKPNDTGTYMSLSDLYSYSYAQKKDLADDVLLEGLAANPGDTDLMRWLAALYEREKNYASALEWWKKVLEKNPSDALVKQEISDLEAKLGK